jgi:hypothetical protein
MAASTAHDIHTDADPGRPLPDPLHQIPAEAYDQARRVNARLDELLPWRQTPPSSWARA